MKPATSQENMKNISVSGYEGAGPGPRPHRHNSTLARPVRLTPAGGPRRAPDARGLGYVCVRAVKERVAGGWAADCRRGVWWCQEAAARAGGARLATDRRAGTRRPGHGRRGTVVASKPHRRSVLLGSHHPAHPGKNLQLTAKTDLSRHASVC